MFFQLFLIMMRVSPQERSNMSLHYLIKAGRRESGLSLREAAARLGLSPSTLYRYEEGLIARIPPEKEEALLRFYLPYLIRLSDRLSARKTGMRRHDLSPMQPRVTPEFLYANYMAADARGRKTILECLRWQRICSRPPDMNAFPENGGSDSPAS